MLSNEGGAKLIRLVFSFQKGRPQRAMFLNKAEPDI